jgi:hypothetical protein
MKHLLNVLAILVLPAVLGSSSAFAQRPRASVSREGGPKNTVANQAKMTAASKHEFQDLSVGVATWQEEIKASRGSETSPMQTQSRALKISTSYNKFFRREWRAWYEGSFLLGQLKGKGPTTTIPDELKRQLFFGLELSPGLMWRTSPVSELGFNLPIEIRYIKWDLISSSALKMDRQFSYSAGLGATYVARFSSRAGIHISVAHQHMWNTVIWSAAYNRVF